MSDFPLGSVWEADSDASGEDTTFVIVRAEGDRRYALVLQTFSPMEPPRSVFDFELDWPFCRKCKRVV